MNTSINKETIKRLLSILNRLTKITITLFDSDMQCLADAGEWQPYCLAIGEHADLLTKCSGCNKENAKKALEQNSPFIYTCHAGITEMVAPIIVDDFPIAYLMFGKFRDTEQIYSSAKMVEETAEKYGLDKERMLDAYEQLPVCTRKEIDDAIFLIDMCIKYITLKKIVYSKEHEITKTVVKYIDEHISEPIKVEDIQRYCMLPLRYISKAIKDDYNESIYNFIIKKRLQKAQELLTSTDKTVKAISFEVGFNDYNYFISVFTKKIGISPTQYRKQQTLKV